MVKKNWTFQIQNTQQLHIKYLQNKLIKLNCLLIRFIHSYSYLCKFTDIIFCCRENATNIKNIKITNFCPKWSFWGPNWIKVLKLVILTPKMVKHIFEIICILTAAKNYTSNFSDPPLGPDHCTSSKASLTAPSNQPYFQCIFQIFQSFGTFFIIFIFILVKLIRLWKWIVLK